MESRRKAAPRPPPSPTPKKKAVVVGGSVAGISCALSLLRMGWDVTIIEKATKAQSSTGAGLCLDSQTCNLLELLAPTADAVSHSSVPLSYDVNRITDSEEKSSTDLICDDKFFFRAFHWIDLHSLLLESLTKAGRDVLWGHQFVSFTKPDEDYYPVKIDVKTLENGQTLKFAADLLVAADGCSSLIRQHFIPNQKLRYSGYVAWRGIVDCAEKWSPEAIAAIHETYPRLGNCLYFDLADKTHSVLYELRGGKLNWLWYVNQPEPKRQKNSVTLRPTNEMIKRMNEEADRVWIPELARLMKDTEEPFINVIYDSDPLTRLYWDNVVLIGDAAHPTTPHGLRSTNMSILDAIVLAECLERQGPEKLNLALDEYQSLRLPVVSAQVLHSRRLGRVKQGLPLEDGMAFEPNGATMEDCKILQQKSMPYYCAAPLAKS